VSPCNRTGNLQRRHFVERNKESKEEKCPIFLRMWIYTQTDSATNIIVIFIYCNWVVTRWQWLFHMYTKYEIGYY